MTTEVEAVSLRRCWRCLQMLPCATEDMPRGQDEWWLCDPCQRILVPDARGRR
jgi:hypothetical protein